MATVRSRGNRATELALVQLFRAAGIKGWRRHAKVIGKPDFVFPKAKLAIFVDGCFWHGCKKHCRMPSSNQSYWDAKIARNMKRDLQTRRLLRARGWTVLRIWEHELRDADRALKRVTNALTSHR